MAVWKEKWSQRWGSPTSHLPSALFLDSNFGRCWVGPVWARPPDHSTMASLSLWPWSRLGSGVGQNLGFSKAPVRVPLTPTHPQLLNPKFACFDIKKSLFI